MLPTVDFCFKGLMENPKVRQGFIAALLSVNPEDVRETTLLPTSLPQANANDKLGVLDVRVKLTGGTQIDMEMQVASFAYWENRILFYLSKMYTDQLKKGETYDKLQKCIHVSILDFIHFPDDEDCYRTISFRDDKTGRQYSDLMEIKILELKKLPKEIPQGENVMDWMKFFSGKKREEFEDMAKANEYLDEAYQMLMKMSADERKRIEYEARERALKDYNTQMKSSKEQGISIGKEQGIFIGKEQGASLTKIQLIQKKVKKQKSLSQIADEMEESEDDIRDMYELIMQYPDKTAEEICESIKNK